MREKRVYWSKLISTVVGGRNKTRKPRNTRNRQAEAVCRFRSPKNGGGCPPDKCAPVAGSRPQAGCRPLRMV
jgi:hypothetical protein